MIYGLLRFVWGLWFLAGLLFCLYAIATLVWGAGNFRAKLRKAGSRIAYAFIWPLAMFTANGRQRVVNVFKQEST